MTNAGDAGAGTLRDALELANKSSGHDVIEFNLSQANPIQLQSALPAIRESVTVDGWSQPGFAGKPQVIISGAFAGESVSGLKVEADSTVIRGLVIQNFDGHGIHVDAAKDVWIYGNFIGTDATGLISASNGLDGIHFESDVSSATIGTNRDGIEDERERNLVSGNQGNGVSINGLASTESVIAGNYIGTDISGARQLANQGNGIEFNNAGGNLVGGVNPVASNLISGNFMDGILIHRGAHSQVIQGNRIGVDVSGDLSLRNFGDGIEIRGGTLQGNPPALVYVVDVSRSAADPFSGTPVGDISLDGVADSVLDAELAGYIAFTEELISLGFGQSVSVSLVAFSATAESYDLDPSTEGRQTSVFVGEDKDANGVSDVIDVLRGGFVADGSTDFGLALEETISVLNDRGVGNGEANLIFVSDGGANGSPFEDDVETLKNMGVQRIALGVGAAADMATLRLIDSQATRVNSTDEFTAALLRILGVGGGANGTTNITVGGTEAAAANIIATNNGDGINVGLFARGNTFLGNSIYQNHRLGIDLGKTGVNLNDVNDLDGGANGQVNFPVLTSASSASFNGQLNASPNETYRVEFFDSSLPDSSGYGEGQRFLTHEIVTTNASGNAFFVVPHSLNNLGKWLSATATDSAGNTSEFSLAFRIDTADPYADALIEYDPLHSGGTLPTESVASDPIASLEAPDFPDGGSALSSGRVSLGHGGRIDLEFVDNRLTNTGNSNYDLRINEVGADVESTIVAVRPEPHIRPLLSESLDPDGDGFYEVGVIEGGIRWVDLDAVFAGFGAGQLVFDAVQLIDVIDDGSTSSSTVGADIDSVAALASIALPAGFNTIQTRSPGEASGAYPDFDTVVTEAGQRDSVSLALAVAPERNVVIDVSTNIDTQAELDNTQLIFTPENWQVPQVVTILAVDDHFDDGDQAGVVTLAVNVAESDVRFSNVDPVIVPILVTDNDTVGYQISRDAALVSESGTSDTFTAILTAQPFSNVTFDVISDDTDEVWVTNAQLIFTPDNWQIPQSIEVVGIDDDFVDGDQLTNVSLVVRSAQSDNQFDGVGIQSVAVRTADNDAAGIILEHTDGFTSAREAGPDDQAIVRLTNQPQSNVLVAILSEDTSEAAADTDFVLLTPANWNTGIAFGINAVDDVAVDGTNTTAITLSVVDDESDDFFDSSPDQSFLVETRDDDEPGFILGSQSLTVQEGETATFTIILTSAPASDVVLDIAANDLSEATFTPSQIVFTPENWGDFHTVEVTGVADNVIDGEKDLTLSFSINDEFSQDEFDALADQEIGVTVKDTDVPGFRVDPSQGSTRVHESGTADTFAVALTGKPESNVVIGVFSDDVSETGVSRRRLTFTPTNWDKEQTVVVIGVDDFLTDGDVLSQVSLKVETQSSNSAFADVADQSIRVRTVDDDRADFELSELQLTVDESGSAASFNVVLTTRPNRNVSLRVMSEDTEEVTISNGRITFTPDTWNVPRTITAFGTEDSSNDGDTVTPIIISTIPESSDDAFDNIGSRRVEVTNLDNDLPRVLGPIGLTEFARPTIEFTEVESAVSYEVWLERLGGDANPVANPTLTTTSYVPEELGVGRYRTWVRANLANQTSTEWDTADFQINSIAPSIHALPFHAQDRSPTVSWDSVSGATSYRVYIRNITAGPGAVVDEIVTGTSLTLDAPLQFGKHRIWVQAIVSGLPDRWSDSRDYYVGPAQLGPLQPTLDQQPQFTWTSVPGIASVELYVSGPAGVVINESGITGTSFTATQLANGLHRWWLRPTHASGQQGEWSPMGVFQIGGRTKINSPVDVTAKGLPTITWDAVDGASSFEIYLLNEDTRRVVHRQIGITDNSWTAFPLSDNRYTAWVRPYDVDGNPTVWSRPHSFEVKSAAVNLNAVPASPLLVTFDRTPELVWTGEHGSTSYEVVLWNRKHQFHEVGLTTSNWTPPLELPGDNWRWAVRARNAAGEVGKWAFSRIDVSARARLLAVTGGSSTTAPTFVWKDVDGAARYELRVDRLTAATTAVIREDQLIGNSYSGAEALAAGNYRAWIRAIDGDGEVAGWSLQFDFSVV